MEKIKTWSHFIMNILKEKFKIRNYEADFNNRIKISSIFNYLQEAASLHADILKFGYKDLIVKNQAWILSRVIVEIHGTSKFGEEIEVETWPKCIDRLFAIRDFNIYNSSNEKIVNATTAWIMIDTNSKRPLRLNDLNHFVPNKDKEAAIIEIPDKIPDAENKEFIYEKNTGYSDIDVNKHVNNVRFIEYALDSMEEVFYAEKNITRIQVNFLSEMKFGEKIQIHKSNLTENKIYIEGQKENSKIFQMTFEYK
jgi:medium-chain acyl-[acyl-carrier-protein] hydrolase